MTLDRKKDMTRTKNFDEGVDSNKEPVTFTLKGEEFICVPEIQGSLLIDFATQSAEGDALASFGMMNALFEAALEEESLARFEALLEDKHRIVSIEQLAAITQFLIEEYSGRPEEQREG